MHLAKTYGLTLIGAGALWAGATLPGMTTATADHILHVGIIQRFGEEAADTLDLVAPWGSQLSLQFADSKGNQQTMTTSKVTLSIVNHGLTQPEWDQRLIFSSHKSFESAYASALEWQSRGVLSEIAQPGEWQVWADRSEYSIQDLQSLYSQIQHLPSVRLVQEERTERPLLSWVVGHYRYNRDRLTITSDGGTIQVGGTLYAGPITVKPNAYGTYTVINQVPLETYLRGVVPHEIGPGAPQTAIEAQAILARTYALRNTHRFEIDDYHLCANTHCQVYKGLSTTPQTDAAIQQTAGQVLTYNGDLIDAVYSSTNGGISAAFEHIWDGEPRPYLQSTVDTVGSGATTLDLRDPEVFRQFLTQTEGYNEVGISRLFRWQKQVGLTDLSAQFRQNQKYLGLPIPEWEGVSRLQILSRAASGRILALQVDLSTPTGTHSIVLEKDQVRLVFQTLLSTMFAIEPILQGDQLWGYTFLGGGFGHGVGMSQYGSYGLSRQGYTTSQILNFYYPGTTLTQLGSLSYRLPVINPS